MPTNTTAKRYRIFIADPTSDVLNLEVTAACSGDSGGFLVVNEPEPDQGGVIARTGKLSLQVSDGYFDGTTFTSWSDNGVTGRNVFNSDLNPTRWAVGNKLRVLVQTGFGGLDSPVFDFLRILKLPDPPYPGNPNIEIEIGDDLALFNWRSPDDDASGVALGEATGKESIVNNLLLAAGVADWAGSIPGGLSRNIPKAGGSWIEQAGKVAFSAGCILYQSGEQTLAKAIDLAPESPILTVTLGEGEVDFKPVRGSEKPCSIVRVCCVDSELVERTEEGQSVSEERAPRAVVPELNDDGELVAGSSEEILIRQTFERWYWDDDYRIFTRETTVNECRGLSVPDQFYFDLGLSKPNSPYSLITSEIKIEKSFFGENATPEEGFQVRTETTIQRLNGAELQDYYKALYTRTGSSPALDYLQLITAETTNTSYRYSGTQTKEIVSQTIARLGAVAGSAEDWSNTELDIPDGLDFIVSGKTEQAWSEVNPGEWKLVDRASSAGQGSGSIAVLSALVRTKDSTTNSTSGQNDPPAAETRPPQYSQIEKERRGVAQFEPIAGEDYAPRERTYQVDYLASDADCETAAEILGAFLWGRHQGFQVTVPYSVNWLNYQPLSRIDVIDGNSRITGLASGVSFVFAADRAIVCANCLKLGLVNESDTTQIKKPYKIKRRLKAGQGQGAKINVLPYGNSATVNIIAGQGQGIKIYPIIPPINITAGQGQGASINAGSPFVRIRAGQGQGASGGVVVWNPWELGATLIRYYKSDSGLDFATSSGSITTWNDSSGNSAHANSVIAPLYLSSGLNSQPVARFYATQNQMTFASTGSMANWTIVALYNASALQLASYLVAGSNQGAGVGGTFAGVDGIFALDGSGGARITNTEPTGVWKIVVWQPDKIFIDGTEATYTSSPTLGSINLNTLGTRSDQLDLYFSGDAAYILICDSVLSTTNRQKVEGFIAHSKGLTSLLPGDHPYKLSPP